MALEKHENETKEWLRNWCEGMQESKVLRAEKGIKGRSGTRIRASVIVR